jgi:glycosyltransferase involved in cell wall biosynthesis
MSVNQETRSRNQPGLQAEFKGARFVIIAGHFDYFGGAERQAVLLAKELIHSYEAHVQFLGWGGDGIFADEIRAVGGITSVFPMDLGQRGLRQKLTLLRLARFIRRELKPEYLLPFVGMHCKVIGSIWKLTGARFCWWNQRDEGRLIYGTKREQRLLRNLSAVVSNSFEGRDFLIQKFNLPESRIRVINNGIEVPHPVEYDPAGPRYRATPDKIVFSMIANLTQYKDHETLLHAFAALRNAEVGQRCQLILAGSYGETTLPLKALAFDLRLGDAVQFAGAMSQAEVHNLLRETDVVVHSSVCEGCPNGALEAMSHGICVLGTDISGMRQALGEEQAATCLAPPGDAQALAQLMIHMASAPALRVEFGRKNLSRIRSEFSVSEMTRAVLDTVLQHRVR